MEKKGPFCENLAGVKGNWAIKSPSISACSLFLSQHFSQKPSQVLWITPGKEEAQRRHQELTFLSGLPVKLIPSYDHFGFLPLVPDSSKAAGRIAALNDLQDNSNGFFVCSPSILIERFIPGNEIQNHSELVLAGEELDRKRLLEWLVETGYERNVRVLRYGEFSVRGEIIDIFSPGFNLPIRILFFDDLVEEIRLFDPDTQRTVKKLEEVVLLPATEVILSDKSIARAKEEIISRSAQNGWSGRQVTQIIHSLDNRRQTEGSLALLPFLYQAPWSIFDFLAKDAVIVIESPLETAATIVNTLDRMEESYLSQKEKGRLLADIHAFILGQAEIADNISKCKKILINPPSIVSDVNEIQSAFLTDYNHQIELDASIIDPELFVSGLGSRVELFAPLFQKIRKWLDKDTSVYFVSDTSQGLERIAAILEHYNQDYSYKNRHSDNQVRFDSSDKGLFLVKGYLEEAFQMLDTNKAFIPEHKLFKVPAAPRRRKSKRQTKVKTPISLSAISNGDLVVHRDKGIGRYLGLVRMNVAGVEGEFVHLEYHGGDKLYVPVDRLGLLEKYVGLEGKEPRLDKLGGRSWETRKAKVKKAIKEVAHELVELYALRKVKKGVSFCQPDEMYRQFEAAFPYDETPDQLEAIKEILEDLQAEYPMDRLLCGDVGFGKTEVAMRAAFLAVASGYQVAVLVPTTLLAEQHERTFRERFANFAVNVASLSRIKPRAQQREILERVKQQEIDILIGTHRLLQNDVVFKRLGLIIVDEEHRFGVKHKEKLKLIARDINCLSLTATPIPRTLQLSLLGIRDLSTLQTPPTGRIAIQTFLAEYDDAIVKEAVAKEIQRGGQVFFVHNRVKGIYRIAEHISSLVPDAKVDVAHGQMDPSELEEKMIRFIRGDINCLVCTTIIESGLDIPSANTLIINRADMLGIADLYQLRGRVGRSSRQAFAYMLVPTLDSMSKDASLRIKAIMETSDLGAGMNLAMHDLKIRGAGNLLGVTQAGQISEVGYDLYLTLLKEAIEDIKGNKSQERFEPEVNLNIPAFIPEEYLPDISGRLELYRWFSGIETLEDKDETMQELEDRFGYVPEEVENLLDIMVIKFLLKQLNCVRLDGMCGEKPKLTLTFGPEGPNNVEKLIALIHQNGRLKLLPGERLLINVHSKDSKGIDSKVFLKETSQVLKELSEFIN